MSVKKKIPLWDDIEHLVERGSLVKLVYDTEIYNLDRTFPGVEEMGFHIKDVAGNEIGAPVMHLKKPLDALRSVVASLITRKIPKDNPEADDFKTFAGKIAHTLDHHYEYIWDRYRDEQKVKYVNKGKHVRHDETVRLFPTQDKDGSLRYVRLHDGGAKISYQVPDNSEDYNYIDVDQDGKETRWRKLPAHAETRGYANTTADDPWIWVTMFMACYPEIFKTHTKAEHKFRVDMFKAVQAFILWGPQGEEGIQPGERYHPVRGKMVPSLKQSDLIPANTRVEGKFNERGMVMPNKSDYEPDYAHWTDTDTRGTSSVEDKLRNVDMPLYKFIEMLADNKFVRRFLMQRAPEEDRQFSDQPLRAFGRYNLDDFLTSHLGMCIETDERYGNMNQAVMVKLDMDWDQIKYEGQPILDIKNKDKLKKAIKNVLFNKFGKVDSPIEVMHLRKTPVLTTAARAMESGRHTQAEYDLAIRNRSKIRKNRGFMNAMMEVYEDNLPQINALMDNPNALDDELMFIAVGRPNYFITNGTDGKARHLRQFSGTHERIRDERDEVYYHAFLDWERARKQDSALLNLIRPHRIEWCTEADIDKELARFKAALSDSREKLVKVNKRQNTGHIERPDVNIPPANQTSKVSQADIKELHQKFNHLAASDRNDKVDRIVAQENAKAYITHLRFEALWNEYNNDAGFAFHDYSWKVDVVDRDGHVMPWDVYEKIDKHRRREAWDNGDFDVRLQKLEGTTTRRIARMMYESGEMHTLMQNFAQQIKSPDIQPEDKEELIEKLKCLASYRAVYEARAAFMIHGNDNRDPESHKHLTLRKARKQAHEILQNLKMNKLHQAGIEDIGALEFLADHKDEAEVVITSYLAELDRIEKEIPPLTPTQMVTMGLDPDTGDDIPYIHEVVHADKLISITIPDEHMGQTLSHPDIGGRFVIVELPEELNADRLNAKLEQGYNIDMIGAENGEHRLAAQAKVLPFWDAEHDSYFNDEMSALKRAYDNSDLEPPKDRSRMAIIKMDDNPRIAGLRSDGGHVDPNLQTINIPYEKGKNTFLGLYSSVLGNVREPVQGIVMRADRMKQDLKNGAIRLREMDNDGLTGREIEHRIAKVMTLNMKKFIQAYDILDKRADEDFRSYDLEAARDEGFEDPAEMLRYLEVLNSHTRYGYSSKLDMFDSMTALFAQSRHKIMAKQEKYNFQVVNFNTAVKPEQLRQSMTYFDLYNRPHAALEGYSPLERAIEMENTAQPAKLMRYTGAYEGHAPESHQDLG